jgi:hypothetical protein
MKTSRFSDAQVIAILKQAESGSPVRHGNPPAGELLSANAVE